MERDDKKGEKDSRVTDILKKIMNTGMGAAFMTEDVVKGLLSEVSLPKELLQNLLQGAKSTKKEFLSSVKTGVYDYLQQVDIHKEVEKILEKYDIEVQAKFTFKKKKSSASPSNLHKRKEQGEEDEDDLEDEG